MIGSFHALNTLNDVSPDIARKLVDTLFRQTGLLMISAAAFVLLGAIGFIGTGSNWYLAGATVAVATGAWRLWHTYAYALHPVSAPPGTWARRALMSTLAAAASWGAWSAVLLFEPEKDFVIVVISAQAACVIGGAVRNCAVPLIAAGQTFLTMGPLFAICVTSGNLYLSLLGVFVGMHIAAALALARFLHRQALQLLIQDEEKTELVNRLERAKREAEAISQHLEVANRHLETLAATDALTGVANRRVFDLTAALEWRRAIREQTPMSMLLMDVDHFKAYNDFYGHQAGDTCLREVAATIRSSLHRPGDLLARYGGEEFAVVLSNTELDGAARVAGDLLAAIAGRRLLHEASAFGHVTVSIGAACIPPQADAAVEQLTALADAALYAAKRGGRNRVHAVEQATVDPATLAATLAVANLQTI